MPESATTIVSADPARPIDASTVCEAFQRIAAQVPNRVALRSADESTRLTWAELAERVGRLAGGLHALGLRPGDSLAILLPNVVECHLVDYATLHTGGVPFTIYNSSSPEQIRHQLDNADARIVVTHSMFLPQVREAIVELGDRITHVVTVDGAGEDVGGVALLTLDEVEAGADPAFDLEASWRAVAPSDLATMVFTSGTTGPAKGAKISHRAIMAQLRSLDAAVPVGHESLLSFLPMAHTGGRVAVHYMALMHGATITACPDITQVPALVRSVRPDSFFSTPRLWEKLRDGINAMIAGTPDAGSRDALEQALAHGLATVAADEEGREVTAADRARHVEGSAMFAPLLATLGLDNVRSAFVGGAPCPPEVVRFFRAVGVPLLEAYGSTETCLGIFNRTDDFRTGTVGQALPGVELRLLEDGELLIRSDMVMSGYRKLPEETAATLDADGWLHSGDLARIDDDGFVTIVDRKKEIIINTAGKNMSPANIEGAIKGESPLIGQIVVVGDARRYVTALITLDPDVAAARSAKLGSSAAGIAELAADPALLTEVDAAVQRGNARLSRVEYVKKYRVLPTVWAPDSEELTPTMKIKRRAIMNKYADDIEALYTE